MHIGATYIKQLGAVLISAATLTACDMVAPVEPTLKPQVRPAATAAPAVVAQPTSLKSARLRSYFNEVQTAQLRNDLLRQDGGGIDTPFTADQLARNFAQIALFTEYNDNFTGVGGASPLTRWRDPVRIQIIFGKSIPPSQRRSDTALIRAYANRLGRITGHPVSTAKSGNFIVVIAGEDDRTEAFDQVVQSPVRISRTSLRFFQTMDRDQYCAVTAAPSDSNPYVYNAAVALIRAENPDLLRLSCIHEEIAQGLGLPNDSDAARPSIFNDDDEFALLTRHDELLLKMLYDPRLRPGMTAADAAPLTRIIARELTGGPL